MLSKRQTSNSLVAIDLFSHIEISNSNILADKTYGTGKIHEYIKSQNANYTISLKNNIIDPWYYDLELYKKHHLIEYFLNKLKAFRRVTTHYYKLASSFLAFIYVASIWFLSK